MTDLNRRTLLAAGALLPGTVRAAERLPAAPAAEPRARLAVTENPFGPSLAARQAILHAINEAPYYVEDEHALRRQIAEREHLDPAQVALSSGSLDALSLLSTDIGRGGHIVAPLPSYTTHLNYAARRGVPTRYVPLTADHHIDFDAMLAQINAETRLIYVCNPNNPTGILSDPSRLKAFCVEASKHAPVIVDEAYFELAPNPQLQTMSSLVKTGADIIISRTFSKVYGMAGLRIGYILGRPERAKQLYSLATTSRNQMGMAAAKASLGDEKYLAGAVDYLRECRSRIYQICKENRLQYLESQGTFVYIDTGRPALKVQAALASVGVAVRVFDSPRYENWIRVGTATPSELDYFGSVLPSVLRRMEAL